MWFIKEEEEKEREQNKQVNNENDIQSTKKETCDMQFNKLANRYIENQIF